MEVSSEYYFPDNYITFIYDIVNFFITQTSPVALGKHTALAFNFFLD